MTDEYSEGYETGYLLALEDFLNDECMIPVVVQAREMYEKKARLAHS